jgi:hypothetical protein
MTSNQNPRNGLKARLTPEECVLILMSYQPSRMRPERRYERWLPDDR